MGEPATSPGWLHAVEFAHNLNGASSALVGGDTLWTSLRHTTSARPSSTLEANRAFNSRKARHLA